MMTPARQQLHVQHLVGTPDVPAQTTAWIRTSVLLPAYSLPDRIVVSINAQTLTTETTAAVHVQQFDVGVGAANTPPPADVTDHPKARFLDPSQGPSRLPYPPHLSPRHRITAVHKLPFGTLVTRVPLKPPHFNVNSVLRQGTPSALQKTRSPGRFAGMPSARSQEVGPLAGMKTARNYSYSAESVVESPPETSSRKNFIHVSLTMK